MLEKRGRLSLKRQFLKWFEEEDAIRRITIGTYFAMIGDVILGPS